MDAHERRTPKIQDTALGFTRVRGCSRFGIPPPAQLEKAPQFSYDSPGCRHGGMSGPQLRAHNPPSGRYRHRCRYWAQASSVSTIRRYQMPKNRTVSIALLSALLFVATSAHAAVITYNFSGTVTEVNSGLLFAGKNVGDSFSGTFSFNDPPAFLSANGPGSNRYQGADFSLAIDGTDYAVSTATYWFNLSADGIELSFGSGSLQGFLALRSNADIYSSPNFPVDLNLSDFDLLSQVQVFDASSEDFAFDTGQFTSLENANAVPAPAAAGLLMAFLGLGAARRRRARG